MLAFVKTLTVRAWCLSIAPRLCWRRLTGQGWVERCEFFEGSQTALLIARASGWVIGIAVERLSFRLIDVRDQEGRLIWWEVFYQDIPNLQVEIAGDPVFREALSLDGTTGRFRVYLTKALGSLAGSASPQWSLCLTLFIIRVCVWRLTHGQRPATSGLLFLERQPWFPISAHYASRYGLATMPIPAPFNPRWWLRGHLSPEVKTWLRRLWFLADIRILRMRLAARLGSLGPLMAQAKGAHGAAVATPETTNGQPLRRRLAVDYTGYFNLERPACYSDLFFWQQSSLRGSDLVLCFRSKRDPLDAMKWTQLQRCGIGAVALNPDAVTAQAALGLVHRPRLHRARRAQARGGVRERTLEARWLREQQADYQRWRAFWTDVFATHDITLYLTWFKYDGSHCAIADALQALGGLVAMYQRSYESTPSSHTAVAPDVFFGFSTAMADIERRSQSLIPYHVTTGYLGDYRFPHLRDMAFGVRQGLQRHGARRVLGLMDENASGDARWLFSTEIAQPYYAFLLQKVLDEPWLGLVVKPKVPSTLRQRLGPVAGLLKRAEATGRCFIFEDGAIHSTYPPAAAALAVDVMVHAHLYAATAGVESALAGVPTLIVDKEGWRANPLYRLGEGRVVFQDWESLWQACVEHWNRPGGSVGFGEWSPLLDEFDPFRDGRAAARMGRYLQWLLEGFKAGLSRDTVMADAAERYAAQWGRDKILPIGTERAG